MTLIDKHVDGVLEITPWAGCLKLGLVNPGLMRNFRYKRAKSKFGSVLPSTI